MDNQPQERCIKVCHQGSEKSIIFKLLIDYVFGTDTLMGSLYECGECDPSDDNIWKMDVPK
jgi:hypothetical protein